MDLWTFRLQVLGVEDVFGGAGQQLSEDTLALGKPRAAQVKAVEIEQVERVVEQPVLAAPREVGVQQPEIRMPRESATTASPSRIRSVAGSCVSASAIVWKRTVQSCPLRV